MNKFKKFFISFLLFFLLLVPVKADSGFDSDWSSSSSSDWGSSSSDWGGSSSSDWSSSSSYGSGYSSSSGDYEASGFDVIMTIIIMIIIIIIVIYYNRKTGGKGGPGSNFTYEEIDTSKINEKIKEFNYDEFKDLAFTIYVEVQNGWMNIDFDSLRNLLTDELFNKYKSDLEMLSLKKQKNIMSDYKLNDFKIIDFLETSDNYLITCAMNIELHDYMVDKDNKVIRGNEKNIIVHDYELTFARGKDHDETTCPNCHAKLDDKATKVCPYCNSVIVTSNHDWVLSNKISKYQTIKK